MASKPQSDDARWAAAARHLTEVDSVLGKVIQRSSAPARCPREKIISWRCVGPSTGSRSARRVAEVLFQRFRALCPSGRVTPAAVIELLKIESNIKAAGLSRQKAIYLRDLAEHFTDNRIPIRKLAKMTDDKVIESLDRREGRRPLDGGNVSHVRVESSRRAASR